MTNDQIKQQKRNKMKKIESFAKIGVSMVFLFVAMAYSSNATGSFDVLLNWVRGPTGISVDGDNDGVIDTNAANDSWVNEPGDNMTGTLIGLNLNMTYGNFSQQVIILGNVGIGTASPGAALDIGGGSGQLADGAEDLLIKGDLEVDDDVRIDGGAITLSADTAVTLSGGVDGINFDSNTLSIDATNNRVGIGDAAPYNTLTVIGSVGVSGSLNATSINTTGGAYFATVSGNVGIGTSSPNDALEVVGNVIVSGLINATNLNTTGQTVLATHAGHEVNAHVQIGNATCRHPLSAFGNANISGILHAGSINVTNSLSSKGNVEANAFVGDGTPLTGIIFVTTPWNISGNNVYLNDSTANFGIGTSSPGTKLDVKGNISSSGNISIVTNNRFCMDGPKCTKYIYYNGSHVSICDNNCA